MKFIIIPLIALLVNQAVKLIVLWARKRQVLGNRLVWTFIWVGQFPSAHTAVLTSCNYLVVKQYGVGAIFAFTLFVSLILIYGLLEDKKRQVLYEGYFKASQDTALVKIVKDQILLDFSGHNLADVAMGFVIGLLTTFLLVNFP